MEIKISFRGKEGSKYVCRILEIRVPFKNKEDERWLFEI